MKRIFLFLLLTSIAFAQVNKDRYSLFDKPIQKEALDHKTRVEADGGVIYDFWGLNDAITRAKSDASYVNLAIWASPQFGIKKDASNYTSKVYNIKYALSSELVTSLVNGEDAYETFVSSGRDVTSADNTSSIGRFKSNDLGSFLVGEQYVVTFKLIILSGSGACSIGFRDASTSGTNISNPSTYTFSTSGTYTYTFPISIASTDPRLVFNSGSNIMNVAVTNISVKKVTNPDLEQGTGANQPLNAPYVVNSPSGYSSTNILTNGGFDTDTQWGKSNATIADGVCHFSNASAGGSFIYIGVSNSTSKRYKVTYTIKNYVSGSIKVVWSTSASGATRNSAGTFTDYITADGGTLYLSIQSNGSTFDIDDVIVHEALPEPNKYQIVFDGSNDYLKTALMTLNQPTTVYIGVKEISDVSTAKYWLDGYTLNSGGIYHNNTESTLKQYAGLNGGTVTKTMNQFALITSCFNGANSYLQLNNNAKSTGNAGSGNMNGLTVGAGGSNTAYFSNIAVTEIRVMSVIPTATQDANIKAWFQSYWGFGL